MSQMSGVLFDPVDREDTHRPALFVLHTDMIMILDPLITGLRLRKIFA